MLPCSYAWALIQKGLRHVDYSSGSQTRHSEDRTSRAIAEFLVVHPQEVRLLVVGSLKVLGSVLSVHRYQSIHCFGDTRAWGH